MTTTDHNNLSPSPAASDREKGTDFQPKFDTSGLIPAIVTDAASGAVLMFAHMNEDALRLTIETKVAHFWSRSRGKLWKKGEESGNELHILEIRTDCDQDAVWISANIGGDGVACHTGAKSCFYRKVVPEPGHGSGVKLMFVAA